MQPDLVEAARRHHDAGELQEAVALYHQILQEDRNHHEVWCLLGEACQALGWAVLNYLAFALVCVALLVIGIYRLRSPVRA